MRESQGFMEDRANARRERCHCYHHCRNYRCRAEVVWFSDSEVLRALSCNEEGWHIAGYLSVMAASGLEIPDANFYHKGIGYIEPACIIYAMLDIDDSEEQWKLVHSAVTQSGPGPCFEH